MIVLYTGRKRSAVMALAHKLLDFLRVRTDPYVYTRSHAERSIVSRYDPRYNRFP